jgi:hypothetical protein
LTNVTDQAWKAVLGSNRGVPLNVFTGNIADGPASTNHRVLATGRNDGSGTRAAYMIEPGVGVSRLVNQFKIGANGFNGIVSPGVTGDAINILQLWPTSDAEDANNNSVLWNPGTAGTAATSAAATSQPFCSGTRAPSGFLAQPASSSPPREVIVGTGTTGLAPSPSSLPRNK